MNLQEIIEQTLAASKKSEGNIIIINNIINNENNNDEVDDYDDNDDYNDNDDNGEDDEDTTGYQSDLLSFLTQDNNTSDLIPKFKTKLQSEPKLKPKLSTNKKKATDALITMSIKEFISWVYLEHPILGQGLYYVLVSDNNELLLLITDQETLEYYFDNADSIKTAIKNKIGCLSVQLIDSHSRILMHKEEISSTDISDIENFNDLPLTTDEDDSYIKKDNIRPVKNSDDFDNTTLSIGQGVGIIPEELLDVNIPLYVFIDIFSKLIEMDNYNTRLSLIEENFNDNDINTKLTLRKEKLRDEVINNLKKLEKTL